MKCVEICNGADCMEHAKDEASRIKKDETRTAERYTRSINIYNKNRESIFGPPSQKLDKNVTHLRLHNDT